MAAWRDFDDWDRDLDWTLRDIRADIGLESVLILAYYRIGPRRWPDAKASARLLR